MANRIFVSVQEGVKEPEWLDKVQDFLLLAANQLGFDNEEVSVLFCNDEYIKELNSSYRNIDAPTDVLSFENDEEYEDE